MTFHRGGSCRPVMHVGPFFFNRRRRAQNCTGAAAFGGVGREISKIIYNKKFKTLNAFNSKIQFYVDSENFIKNIEALLSSIYILNDINCLNIAN